MHVGLVGAGRIGAFHARTLSGLATVDRLTITDVDAAVAERAAAGVGARFAPTPEALVEAGVDALVIADADAGARAARCGSRRRPVCRRSARSRSRSTSPTLDDADRRRRARRDPRAGRLPAALRRRLPRGARRRRERRARQRCSSLRAATHDPAPPPEAYIAALGRHLPRPAHPRLRRDPVRHGRGDRRGLRRRRGARDAVVRGARRRRRRRRRAPARAAARSRSSPGRGTTRSATTSGSRSSAPRDSIAVGLDARSPLRSVEPGVRRRRRRATATSSTASSPPTAPSSRPSSTTVRARRPTAPARSREARAALLVALAADRSRAERRPVAIDEVGWRISRRGLRIASSVDLDRRRRA